ncbi:hypothetical protein [Nocardia sp. NPDC051463]|uniref:hypothetical protein n=1 Tax=Nocardia sp. NPDC051463 TaxID=3154845 RepID=UPI00344CF442
MLDVSPSFANSSRPDGHPARSRSRDSPTTPQEEQPMSRQSLPLGTYGRITSKRQPNGSWRATTRYRDDDGITRPVHRFGTTKGRAEGTLRESLTHRTGARGRLITRDTKLTDLADLWLAEKVLQEGITEQSLDLYRMEIEVSIDCRASKGTVKIKSALGGLRVWEATTSRIDAHLKRIVLDGHREKARRHRVILSEMMSMAVRHDAINRNPVREVADLPRKRQKPRAKDFEIAVLNRCRSRQRGGCEQFCATWEHRGEPSAPEAAPARF